MAGTTFNFTLDFSFAQGNNAIGSGWPLVGKSGPQGRSPGHRPGQAPGGCPSQEKTSAPTGAPAAPDHLLPSPGSDRLTTGLSRGLPWQEEERF
jgi:hypothetical protein